MIKYYVMMAEADGSNPEWADVFFEEETAQAALKDYRSAETQYIFWIETEEEEDEQEPHQYIYLEDILRDLRNEAMVI